jgi:LacI family transcriptional regulator
MWYTAADAMKPAGHIRVKIPRVAIRIPAAVKTARDLLNGILRYARLYGPWSLHVMEGRERELGLSSPSVHAYSGMILDCRSGWTESWMARLRVPVIWLPPFEAAPSRPAHPLEGRPRILPVNPPIGVHAAKYFLERGFEHFAYAGEIHGIRWSEERRLAFVERLAEYGKTCRCLAPADGGADRGDYSREQARLVRWLKSLPKPVAVFAANDIRARQVLDACRRSALPVPQAVAVLGVDDDELICENAYPTLSSIRMSCDAAGFEAARLLDGIMRRPSAEGDAGNMTITYGFYEIVTRRSTESPLYRNRAVQDALELVRINAGRAMKVGDLVRELHVSRRTLEQRVRQATGHTLHEAIQQARLDRAARLLAETGLSVKEVAAEAGFRDNSHLNRFFKCAFGVAPSEYRTRLDAGRP